MATSKLKDSPRVLVKVFLYSIQPVIWRRFSISQDASFAALHEAVQAVMGWENKHPHEFRHGKGKRLVDVIGPVGLDEQAIGEFQDEAAITVGQHLGRRQLPIRMLYRYDFADEWIHEIVFEKRAPGDAAAGPEFLEGERACPPEDFGGAFAFMQALHGEIEWMNPGYDPAAFDPKEISFTRPRRAGAKRPRRS